MRLTQQLDGELGWTDVSIQEKEEFMSIPRLRPYSGYFLVESDDMIVDEKTEGSMERVFGSKPRGRLRKVIGG